MAVPVNRRRFLANLLKFPFLAVLAIRAPDSARASVIPMVAASDSSRVVSVFHRGATDNSEGKDDEHLDSLVVEQMVNKAVMSFTGALTPGEAWRQVIPDVSKKIAIKVNCQIQGIYTKAKVVKPITDGLLTIGVKPENIIIYDMTDNAFDLAGFFKNKGPGIQVGTVKDFGGYTRYFFDHLANLLVGGYENSLLNYLAKVARETDAPLLGSFLSLILNVFRKPYDCEYLINVPVLKALEGYSGVTLSMKNHYGSFGNPAEHHEDIMDWLPYINSRPEIRGKTRLIVMDGIFVEYKWVNGRDQTYVDEYKRILVSNDPVAMDHIAWQLIEAKRKEHNLGVLEPSPTFIEKAAEIGLGNNMAARIEYIELNLS